MIVMQVKEFKHRFSQNQLFRQSAVGFLVRVIFLRVINLPYVTFTR